jgi:hypothetical protein
LGQTLEAGFEAFQVLFGLIQFGEAGFSLAFADQSA